MLVKYVLISILVSSAPCAIQCHNICNFTLSVAQRLHNDGFYRNLTYDIFFDNPSIEKDGKTFLYDVCIVSVMQILPAGLFVNPDELSDLRRSDKLHAFPNSGVNIEVPTELARPSVAYIFTIVSKNRVNTWLPIHARYNKPVMGGGYATNLLEGPKIFVRCTDQRLQECDLPVKTKTYLCEKNPESCVWKEVVPKMVNKVLKWPVPVGDLNHLYTAASVTLVSVIGAAVCLMKAIHEHKVAYNHKKSN